MQRDGRAGGDCRTTIVNRQSSIDSGAEGAAGAGQRAMGSGQIKRVAGAQELGKQRRRSRPCGGRWASPVGKWQAVAQRGGAPGRSCSRACGSESRRQREASVRQAGGGRLKSRRAEELRCAARWSDCGFKDLCEPAGPGARSRSQSKFQRLAISRGRSAQQLAAPRDAWVGPCASPLLIAPAAE